ncbi:MAG: DinB family protein [Bacteroidetes bacterium]|nr:DinB family protein [Bacteroidota bacterium]
MQFNLDKSFDILTRTPAVLEMMLDGIHEDWIHQNEGAETWSPYDVIGHLIHGEKTDWITRLEIVLSDNVAKHFKPFDRFAQFDESKGKTIQQLLQEFKLIRQKNMAILKSKNITEADFSKKGIHPVFGEVTLENLLATWTAHDLGHLGQIARVMAKQYTDAVGPWKAFLPILAAR